MDITTTLPFILLGVAMLLIIIMSGYVKASPDKAFIISGLRKNPKVLIGKAGIKIPFLEKKDELDLQLIPIDVRTSSPVPTADYININVDAVVNVKVSDNPEKIKLAAQNFLNKKPEYIAQVAREVLEGNTREIVGQMKLSTMVSDRQKFAELVKQNAEPDLAEMGLDIVSFNVQNFVDDEDVIKNLGVDNIETIRKDAAIAKAKSQKEIRIQEALAAQEANEAQVASETIIAERQNELAIRKAELKREADIKQAQADASYRIQEEEQRKLIEASAVMADTERQARSIELKKKEAEVMEQRLDAEVRKKAEAEKYARQQRADAELYERQKKAEAERFEKEQEAKAITTLGEAEAEAIRLKGIAEAEAIEKKADAMQKYGKAAMLEMLVDKLPEMAKAVAEPLASIDKVTIIEGGNGEGGVNSMNAYVPAALARTIETVKETTGFDITEIMKADTYDAKVNKNVSVKGLENAGKVVINQDFADVEAE